jgi:perosamine synthetase
MDDIMDLGITVIEDAAQAPGARYKGRYAGTLGHIGVYSLNYHKQIHSGEGGIVVTNDDEYAERLQLIRNHAEVVVGPMGSKHTDLIGYNYRLGEMEAAIARCQLRKLDSLNQKRREVAAALNMDLWNIKALYQQHWNYSAEPACYLYAMRYLEEVTHTPRDKFVEAVRAEGVPLWGGYVRPIYREPYYQMYGGNCPTCERMHDKELIYTNIAHAGTREADIVDFTTALHKVYRNLGELKG